MTRMVKQEQKPVIRNYGERTPLAKINLNRRAFIRCYSAKKSRMLDSPKVSVISFPKERKRYLVRKENL